MHFDINLLFYINIYVFNAFLLYLQFSFLVSFIFNLFPSCPFIATYVTGIMLNVLKFAELKFTPEKVT